MEQNKVLEITLKNGRCVTWGKGEWDSYYYDGAAIIIKKDGSLVGVYNLANVICAVLKETLSH